MKCLHKYAGLRSFQFTLHIMELFLPIITFSLLILSFSKRVINEQPEQKPSQEEKLSNALKLLLGEE